MSGLYPPSTLPASSHMNAKLNLHHLRYRYLGLILGNHVPFLQSASGVGTLRRQGYFDYLIDGSGDGTTTSASVLSPWFASRFLWTCFGVLPRERRRLPSCSAQRFF